MGDVVLISQDQSKFQVFLRQLNDSVDLFGLGFVPSNCKALVRKRTTSKPSLIFTEEKMRWFAYLGSSTTPGGRTWEGISSCI